MQLTSLLIYFFDFRCLVMLHELKKQFSDYFFILFISFIILIWKRVWKYFELNKINKYLCFFIFFRITLCIFPNKIHSHIICKKHAILKFPFIIMNTMLWNKNSSGNEYQILIFKVFKEIFRAFCNIL